MRFRQWRTTSTIPSRSRPEFLDALQLVGSPFLCLCTWMKTVPNDTLGLLSANSLKQHFTYLHTTMPLA
ncbi:unnamed protein product [Protopolystoma xenopodis]|uniref:Uncharacterized protein n=1 Tax=Protopolystoma xenopodis TaxID=117903 RepID=A0A3S5CPR2_9PLAT|nr:unnamed protein product [Protopolystoma xenopodis]